MAFTKVNYYHFRNIQDQSINFKAKNIGFIGKNAQGKTNLLESLYLLSFGSTFRGTKENNFINLEQKEASLIGEIELKDEISKIQIKFQNGKSAIFIDDARITDRKELLNYFPVIVFKHEDIFLITGNPEIRRNFMDQVISLCQLTYIDDLRRYKRLLKQRNAILKSGCMECLDIIDQQLIAAGKMLIQRRISVVEEFNETFGKAFNEITGTNLDLKIKYVSSWSDNPLSDLQKNREKDLYYKMTTTGPHRDQYLIMNGKFDFSKIASTGQRRILALLLKINQAILVAKKRGQKPILLFDDVLLELDGIKKRNILKVLPNFEQAFWTFLPEENYQSFELEDLKLYHVENGGLEEVSLK